MPLAAQPPHRTTRVGSGGASTKYRPPRARTHGPFHFSLFVLEGQAAIALASDPLGRGWDLFTADLAIDYALLSPNAIAYLQVGSVVLGHVAGVVLAHDRALIRLSKAVGPARSTRCSVPWWRSPWRARPAARRLTWSRALRSRRSWPTPAAGTRWCSWPAHRRRRRPPGNRAPEDPTGRGGAEGPPPANRRHDDGQ